MCLIHNTGGSTASIILSMYLCTLFSVFSHVFMYYFFSMHLQVIQYYMSICTLHYMSSWLTICTILTCLPLPTVVMSNKPSAQAYTSR
ncbi:hypothetical protein MHYP_G00154470 [Metynnis hypsauchen]